MSTAHDKFDFITEGAPEVTWGDVTSYAINELDWDQGGHASNSDGQYGTHRDGLANVVEDGNIFATAEFIDDLLP